MLLKIKLDVFRRHSPTCLPQDSSDHNGVKMQQGFCQLHVNNIILIKISSQLYQVIACGNEGAISPSRTVKCMIYLYRNKHQLLQCLKSGSCLSINGITVFTWSLIPLAPGGRTWSLSISEYRINHLTLRIILVCKDIWDAPKQAAKVCKASGATA